MFAGLLSRRFLGPSCYFFANCSAVLLWDSSAWNVSSPTGPGRRLRGRQDGLWPAKRYDHRGHPRRQNPLPRLEVVGDALRAQASLLDGPIGELYGHVAVGHAVEPERLHL